MQYRAQSQSKSSFKRHSCPFGKEPIELKEDELYSQRMVNGLKKKDNSYQLFMRNLFRQKVINETFHSAFHMSGKSHTIGDFTVSRPSQIFPTYRERGSLYDFEFSCVNIWNGRERMKSPVVWDFS